MKKGEEEKRIKLKDQLRKDFAEVKYWLQEEVSQKVMKLKNSE